MKVKAVNTLVRKGKVKRFRGFIGKQKDVKKAVVTLVEGQTIGNWFLRVEKQPEVGTEAYDKGDQILRTFFEEQLKKFMVPDLLPEGRKIIEACLAGASVEEYERLIEGAPIITND